jgi:hypothetical protein
MGGSLVLLAGLLAAAVAVEDTTGCLDTGTLTREIETLLPEGVELEAIVVEVKITEGVGGLLSVTLLVESAETQPLLRPFEIERAACGSLARLLARVVARHVTPIVAEPIVDVAPVATPHESEASPSPQIEETQEAADRPKIDDDTLRFVLRPHAGVGVGTGVWPLIGDLRLELGGSFGLAQWPALVAMVRGTVVQPIALGGGQAQLMNGVVGLGGTWAVDVGFVEIAPRVLAIAGPAVAWGTGFNNGAAAVLPHTGALASVTIFTPFGLFIDVGSELVFTPAALATQSGALVQMSFVAIYAQVGFAFAIPFGGTSTPSDERIRPDPVTAEHEETDHVKVKDSGGHEDVNP